MHFLLYLVPKNLLSWLSGIICQVPLVPPLNRWLIGLFARWYQVNMAELNSPIESYSSLSQFFIRELKAGIRPIGEGLVSPVDGEAILGGVIEQGTLLQVKGRAYRLVDLLGDQKAATLYEGGRYLTIYLAPPDYHHIHCPVDGAIEEVRYLPGALWPVNSWGVNSIDGLFARNERVAISIKTPNGKLNLVAVGALNVGSITLAFQPGFRSNSFPPGLFKKEQVISYSPPLPVTRGEKLATFNFGSTVVLVFEPGLYQPRIMTPKKLKYGEPL